MPTVSVIMGVRDAEDCVRDSVMGILRQSFTDLELIVINDGSSDDTGRILDELAVNDDRMTVVHQENQGLTRSLITACDLATGRYIARQDADDVSLPSRLEKQLTELERDPSAVLATCWVEDVTAEGVVCGLHHEVNHSVKLADGTDQPMRGVPAHGSVMMRRDALDKAGGYRACFYYAQDSDLWLRMTEVGNFVVVPEVLYRRTVAADCISSRFRAAQQRFCELAEECFRASRQGSSDRVYLEEAEQLATECRRRKDASTSSRDRATSLLLLGAALADREPKLAGRYFKQAVITDWFHLRAWKGLLTHQLRQLLVRTQ